MDAFVNRLFWLRTAIVLVLFTAARSCNRGEDLDVLSGERKVIADHSQVYLGSSRIAPGF